MDHILSELGLRLTYLRGRYAIDAVDQEQIFDELLDGTPSAETPVWAARRFLSDYDHLLLASDLASGATLGMLGAQDRHTEGASLLWLETGFVVERGRGRNLMRRMIALMLLRVASFGAVPDCLATVTRNPIAIRVLQKMAPRLGGVSFAPTAEGPVVDLSRARLVHATSRALGLPLTYAGAHRATSGGLAMLQGPGRSPTQPAVDMAVAGDPMLGLLDFRQAPGAELMADLRKLYRSRGMRPAGRILAAKSRLVRARRSQRGHVSDIAAS